MKTMEPRLNEFFAAYETRTNRALQDPPEEDVEGTIGAFADCFVEANPNGVVCGKNDKEFRKAIPKGLELYRSLGTKSMSIETLETTPLDEFHAMVRAHWKARYEKKDGSKEVIDFDVIYLLQILDEKPRIFAYITGDEQKAYKEKGLIPE